MSNVAVLQTIYWGLIGLATYWSFRYFRDLGDITQKLLTVTRENMVFAIRHEYKIILSSLLCVGIAAYMDYTYDLGVANSTVIAIAINLFFISFPYIWLHYGLRNQQNKATYYSIAEARNYVRPKDSVIVLANGNEARAHPDYHIKRPHLAGNSEGLGGENVIMTYCCMTHLGLGFKPEIDGQPQELNVLAQIGNNLIMRDSEKGEPIQQMYGTRECDGRWSESAMQQWPTFRMSFRGFQKAYPNGTVFLNKIPSFWKNPFLYFLDHFVEAIFLWGTVSHHTNESLMFETMDSYDNRLPLKELVWGFNIGKDSVAYTEDFVLENGGIVNATVGDKNIVIAWDNDYESMGVYYNHTDQPIETINFWGKTSHGDELKRVETVKAETYWCVWANYFPETDLNRSNSISQPSALNIKEVNDELINV